MKKLITLALLLLPFPLFGQATTGYHRAAQVITRGNSGVQAQLVPNARVSVTLTSTGAAATIYSDPLLSSPIASSLVTADLNGNYSYYIPLNECVTENISVPGGGHLTVPNVCNNSSSSLVLQTNGTNNPNQNLLNLIAGTNIVLSNTGGAVTINASSSGGSDCSGTPGYLAQFGSGNCANSPIDFGVTTPNTVTVAGPSDDETQDIFDVKVNPYAYNAISVFGLGATNNPGGVNVNGGFSVGGGGSALALPPLSVCLTGTGAPLPVDCISDGNDSGSFTISANADVGGVPAVPTLTSASIGLTVSPSHASFVTINAATTVGVEPTTVATFNPDGLILANLTPGTSPPCPNGPGGALTQSGCTGSGGASITINGGSSLASPVNFQNGSAVAGQINFTNPSGSDVIATVTNAYALINGVNCPLGSAGCALPPYCAGPTCANLDQNNPNFATAVLTTTAAITSTSLVIPVVSTAGWPSTGCGWTAPVVESICWDSIDPTNLYMTGLTNRRGTNNWTAQSHVSGSTIQGNVYSLATSATSQQLIAISSGGQAAFSNGTNPALAQTAVFGGNTRINAQLYVAGLTTVNGLGMGGTNTSSFSSNNPQIVTCPAGTGLGYVCNDLGVWVAASGSGISGLVTGYLPIATSTTTLGNSTLDYNVTNASDFTFGAPVVLSNLSGSSGNCVQLGTGGLLTAASGSCSAATITLTTTGTSGAATYSGGTLNIPVYVPTSGAYFLLSPSGGQTITIPSGFGTSIGQTNTASTPVTQDDTQMFSYPTNSWNNGGAFNGNSDWLTIAEHHVNEMCAHAGICQWTGGAFTHTGTGDTHWQYGYTTCWGGLTNANDEGCGHLLGHLDEQGIAYGPTTSSGTALSLVNVPSPSCWSFGNGCSQRAYNSDDFPVGGYIIDSTTPISTLTIGSVVGSVGGAIEYALSSGTVTPSTAIGTITSCTTSVQGKLGVYGTQTCVVNVTSGSFVSSANIYHIGRFMEEDSGVTVTGSAPTQTITMQSQYPFFATEFIAQGGPGGNFFESTAGYPYSAAYFIGGAPDSTHLLFGNCLKGACGSGGNIIQPDTTTNTPTLSRVSNVVTASPYPFNMNVTDFPVGSSVVIAGYTPSDLNGTFTVVTNSEDNINPVITWAQTGADENSSVVGTMTKPLPQITLFPGAAITGTNNTCCGSANLATNHMTVATSDVLVGAPTSEWTGTGVGIYGSQTAPANGSNPSTGIFFNDQGPTQFSYAFAASNVLSHGVAGAMFNIQGSYAKVFNIGYRPANNGCLLCVGGAEPVSSNAKPYYVYQDGGSHLDIEVNPTANTFLFGSSGHSGLIAASLRATDAASAFATGTTVNGSLICLASGTNCNGVSGGTSGNVAIFGSASTITSSIALGNSGSDIPQLSSGLLASSVIPWAVPGAIGSTTPNTGAFTTLTATTSLGVGSSPPSGCATNGCMAMTEASSAGTPTSGVDYVRADSVTHRFLASYNGGNEYPLRQVVTGGVLYTTATSDATTITGVSSSSTCTFSPTNATAAGATVAAWLAVTTNTVTINHVATTASGGTVSVVCTIN